MKKNRKRLTEGQLRSIIRQVIREGYGVGSPEYNLNHSADDYYDNPSGNIDTNKYEFDQALNAESEEEYDRRMKTRSELSKISGDLAMDYHPQSTPWGGRRHYDATSYARGGEPNNWFNDRAFDQVYEGRIRKAVRKALNEMVGRSNFGQYKRYLVSVGFQDVTYLDYKYLLSRTDDPITFEKLIFPDDPDANDIPVSVELYGDGEGNVDYAYVQSPAGEYEAHSPKDLRQYIRSNGFEAE